MSNLEELIERLCPDGVEYKYLADVVTIKRGVRLIKKELKDNAKYPVYQNSLIPLGYYDDYNCEANKTMIITAGAAGDIVYSNTKFWAADDCFYFICNRYIDDKFLYYVLMSQQRGIYSKVRKASIPRLPRIVIEKIKLPVPPLEVQREIVRILDNFTFLTTELAARQKQYEYYRDLLFLSLKAEYRFIPEFAKTYIGLVTTMTQHYVKEGVKLLFNSSVKENHFDFPKMVYLDNEFAEKNSSRMHKLGDIITVHTGDVGTSAIIDETLEGSLGFATIVTRIYNQEDVLPKYVSHYLNSNENKNNIYKLIKGDRNNLNLKDFNKLRVPIPSLEQQQRIVDILDRFDTLCNDISSGLPAEIEMRQKQYEYYRDKLLTFKELKKEA